jgi:hypothetical protein
MAGNTDRRLSVETAYGFDVFFNENGSVSISQEYAHGDTAVIEVSVFHIDTLCSFLQQKKADYNEAHG